VWLVLTRFHWLNFTLIVLYVGYRSFIGWARWTILLLFLLIVLAYCWHTRKRWLPLWSFGVAHNRGYFHVLLIGGQSEIVTYDAGLSAAEKARIKYDTQDFANFDYLTFVLSFMPKRTGDYTYGAQYLQLFTEPIPRILWKGKPVGAPVRTFNISQYGNFVGLTFSLVGDAWCSGGWVGLIITFTLVAGILGLLHRWFWRNQSNPMAALFYLSALSMTPQWFRDGGISIAKFMFWTWLPLLVWLGMVWVAGGRLFPAYSILLPRGAHVRFVQPKKTGA
jgi:hypothetical protein